jgi:ABC-2 type transport system permease protein
MNAFNQSILRILALVKKELLSIFKDPRALGTLLVPPIIQCFVFGYAASYDLNNIPYALLDRSHSAAAREMVAHLDGTGLFHRVIVIERPEDVRKCMDDGSVVFVLSIGQDFEKELLSGRKADVQVISDGRNSNTAGTALSYVNSAISTFNAQWRSDHGLAAPSIGVATRAWYNPNLETRWSMVPALIGTLTLLQTLLLASLSVAREREQGTFDQLLVTPMRPFEIMVGKTVPVMIIGIVQATNVLAVAQLWFHIPFEGSLVPLYVGLFIFLLAAVGVGLFLSSISRTMQQAMMYSFAVIMPVMLLSGFTTPIANMPRAIQWLTYLNPLRYCVDISRRVYLDGAGLVQIAPELAALAALAAVTLTGSAWMFRRKLY